MFKLKNYLLKTYSSIFFSIFLPLITVASIIILVQISQVTAIVQLSVKEMFQLYIYILPQILFFTIPLSFFIAGVMTINKLSSENEMVVLFALGINPNRITAILFRLSIFLTFILLMTSLIIVPHTQQLYKNFINFKKTTATFNIKASEFGQKFGDWMLYIGTENINKTYSDVALFKPDNQKREFLVIADKARISNQDMQLKFKLLHGKSFIYEDEKLTQINFDKMQINDTSILRQLQYVNSIEYWKGAQRSRAIRDMLFISVMLSLFPILSIPLFMALGVVNSRHQRSFTYLFIFIAISLYFALFISLSNVINYYAIPLSALIWIVGSYALYYKKILKRY